MVTDLADRVDVPDGLALGPIVQVNRFLCRQNRGNLANGASMGFLDLTLPINAQCFMLADESRLDGLHQAGLIAFDHQQVQSQLERLQTAPRYCRLWRAHRRNAVLGVYAR